MKIIINNPKQSVTNFFRRAGYHFQKKEKNEIAFIRRLTDRPFPRFHAFCRVDGGKFLINIHLDHKRASYKGHRTHSGEYGDSKLLREETERLKAAAGG